MTSIATRTSSRRMPHQQNQAFSPRTTRYNKIVASFLGFVAIAAFIAAAIADRLAVGKRFAGSMRPSRLA